MSPMPPPNLSVCVTQETDYLLVKVLGNYSLAASKEVIARVRAESLARNCNPVVLDISETVGEILSFDRFQLGEYAAGVWRPPLLVVVVYRVEDIDGFFENTASNRGAFTAVVPDVQTALRWLAEKSGNKPRTESIRPAPSCWM
jgi:hypothetical protein